MIKLPPIEKIPEAYSAIVDNRVDIIDNTALVKSSDLKKVYTIRWHNKIYFSNDNSSYWQGYPGYPVLAVLMLQGQLPYNESIALYFKNINWHALNEETKRDYKASLNKILSSITKEEQDNIYKEIAIVYESIKSLDIELTKKRNF